MSADKHSGQRTLRYRAADHFSHIHAPKCVICGDLWREQPVSQGTQCHTQSLQPLHLPVLTLRLVITMMQWAIDGFAPGVPQPTAFYHRDPHSSPLNMSRYNVAAKNIGAVGSRASGVISTGPTSNRPADTLPSSSTAPNPSHAQSSSLQRSTSSKYAIVADNVAATGDDVRGELRLSSLLQPPRAGHIMISYKWDNQNLAKQVEQRLKRDGHQSLDRCHGHGIGYSSSICSRSTRTHSNNTQQKDPLF
jgi:hypothetical protein